MTDLVIPDDLHLGRGAHDDPNDGFCVMEAWSHIRGLGHTDRPDCASPVITAFLIGWNDGLPSDEERDRLLMRYLLVDLSKGTDEEEHQRSLLALDWLIRTFTPAFLELVPELAAHAAMLRALPEVTDDNASSIREKVRATGAAARDVARTAAWDAAGDAAGAAARAAAWTAAWTAARAAAWTAAGAAARAAAWDAAWDAAYDAARAAAGDAAWVAAWAAAGDALAPVVSALQESAHELIGRMIAVTDEVAS